MGQTGSRWKIVRGKVFQLWWFHCNAIRRDDTLRDEDFWWRRDGWIMDGWLCCVVAQSAAAWQNINHHQSAKSQHQHFQHQQSQRMLSSTDLGNLPTTTTNANFWWGKRCGGSTGDVTWVTRPLPPSETVVWDLLPGRRCWPVRQRLPTHKGECLILGARWEKTQHWCSKG